jgi:hypothetical protein
MSEPQDAESTPRPRTDWDRVTAIAAIVIGLVAVAVAAYTAIIQREQVRAQVWTRLFFANSDSERTLMVINKGVGPAHIQSVRFYVDGKAQPDWAHVFAGLGLPAGNNHMQSTLNGIVVAANERMNFLSFRTDDDWIAFRTRAQAHLKLRACYCSVLDECLLFDERTARSGHGAISDQVTPVDRCERADAEEFNE